MMYLLNKIKEEKMQNSINKETENTYINQLLATSKKFFNQTMYAK